jgi:UDP-N-acetylglucosamine 2-epimerase
MVKVHLIAAARPNFMKIAPLYHALTAESWCDVSIVHTGQHYDANMSTSNCQGRISIWRSAAVRTLSRPVA